MWDRSSFGAFRSEEAPGVGRCRSTEQHAFSTDHFQFQWSNATNNTTIIELWFIKIYVCQNLPPSPKA
jgi:hypothetical protein